MMVVLLNFKKVKEMVEEFFNGQYEVLKFLGEGSFAQVYLVKQTFLNDKRAMKIIKEPLTTTKNLDPIFHEVRIATKLRHENIIDIYDAGLIHDFAYFVLEYVPGGDLEDYRNSYMKMNMPIPIPICLDIMKQILLGLMTLHLSDPIIIHRDLKTKNILMNYDDEGVIAKISDFGFARELSSSADDFEVGGTKPYMAPECFKSIFSTQSDVYAVGVIFYLLLTGAFPYKMDEYGIEDIVEGKPWNRILKKPSYFDENIPKFIDRIVMKSLNINPEKRYDDAKDFLDDLDKAIDQFKEYAYYQDYLNEKEELNDDNDDQEGYGDYLVNENIIEAFRLAKIEERLDEASSILEKEVLKDYDVRRTYAKTLRLWKGDFPDAKLISEAFSVTLKGENYGLAVDLLKEAFAYNPILKEDYGHFIDLWSILIDLEKNKNLNKAVDALDDLMNDDGDNMSINKNNKINEIYKGSIDTLKTYDKEKIMERALALADDDELIEASKLLEFLVVYDEDIKDKYAYKLSLWKQDLSM